MEKPILVLGDVMLDCYIEGKAQRLSPEAPVPVVNVDNEFYKLGGAANVAQNIAIMNAPCSIMGWLGNDFGGKKLNELFEQYKISNLCQLPDKEMITTVNNKSGVRQSTKLFVLIKRLFSINQLSGWKYLCKIYLQ